MIHSTHFFLLLLVLVLCASCSAFSPEVVSTKKVFRTSAAVSRNNVKQHNRRLHMSSASIPGATEVVATDKSAGFKIPDGLQLTFNAGLWYLISAFYNIYNKKALNALSLPVLVATIQMGTGVFVFIPLWLAKIRSTPFSNKAEFKTLLWHLKSVATFATFSHIAGVVALGSGTVSFTQVVKAAEPVFTALLAAIFTRTFLSWQSYLSLLPVVLGVSVVSANELTFSWFCLCAGFISNIFAAARSVFGKVQMSGDVECVKKITSENYYSMITIISFILLIPITAIMEGPQIVQLFRSLQAGGPAADIMIQGLRQSFISGILFYMYNELSFKVLNKVNAVSHAIANTVKRVVIILSSVLVFRNPLNLKGQIGSAVTILGLFVYSLSESHAKMRKQREAVAANAAEEQ